MNGPRISYHSKGADVPYGYAADCLGEEALSTANLVGTDFKFVEDFENSFSVGYPDFNTGSAQERFHT